MIDIITQYLYQNDIMSTLLLWLQTYQMGRAHRSHRWGRWFEGRRVDGPHSLMI